MELKVLGTMTEDLLALSDWLAKVGVTPVAMECAGEYWRPVYNLLEGNFTHERLQPPVLHCSGFRRRLSVVH